MAVVMTTKFYEEDTPAWHDLSKIVFTSPNIDSPNTAGTRSHILPGKTDLALWYEDDAKMYEIESAQITHDTSYYYYYYTVVSGIDLDSNPTTARITVGNYDDFMRVIVEAAGIEEPIGYVDVTANIVKETLDPGYLSKVIDSLDKIYYSGGSTFSETIYKDLYCPSTTPYGERVIDTTGNYTTGWKVEVIDKVGGGVEECYIDFEFSTPTRVTYMTMEATEIYTSTYYWTCGEAHWMVDHWDYYDNTYTHENEAIHSFIGNFKIQAKKNTPEATWVDLYTGYFGYGITPEVACFGEVIMTDNSEYYIYYRILILNNDSFEGLASCNTWNYNCFSLRNLKFYRYEYEITVIEEEQEWAYDYLTLFLFDDDLNRRELNLINAEEVSGDPIETIHDTNINVEGTINISMGIHNLDTATKYITNVNEVGASSVDYQTVAEGYSVDPVISGTTGIDGVTGTINIVMDLNILTAGYMEVIGETKIENGYISTTLSGQQLGINYINSGFDITTDIVYTTVVSGPVTSGTIGDVAVTGYTHRHEDRYSAQRGYCYDVALLDTVGTGIIPTGAVLYSWDGDMSPAFSAIDSVSFKITLGEAYDCRLTAWDDVTHSTTLNALIAGDYVRVSALAFRAEGTILAPELSTTVDHYIASPIYNRIFKGNVVYNEVNYYYGDFDLSYRTEPGMIGDYLIFKPMLYGIDDTIPYGIHDHVIVLHYTYT